VPLKEAPKYFQFKPISNPINDFLWSLLQEFLMVIFIFSLIALILFYLFFKFTIRRPLKIMINYLDNLKQYSQSIVSPPKINFAFKEIEKIMQSLYEYNRSLIESKNLIEAQRQKAERNAIIDALSGLQNRRAFDQKLNTLLQNEQKIQHPIAFLLFDCDYFKAINDTYGHEMGDSVIRTSAQILQTSFSNDFPVYRIGGDEFAVFVEHKSLSECFNLAQKAFDEFSNKDHFAHLGILDKIHFSIGISFIDEDNTQKISQLHPHADIALYQAKNSMHHKIQIYRHEQKPEASTLISTNTLNAINQALTSGEGIAMHFQPVFLPNQQCHYYESLIRIRTPEGLIYPGEIFEVVTHRHLSLELDIQVIKAVAYELSQHQSLRKKGLSINLSADTLLNPHLTDFLAPLQPYTSQTKIVIEVLEDTYIDNMAQMTETLNKLKQAGFYLALDDFGSGYSSIRYLASMPVDIIKFDITLTHALISDPKTESIIKATAKMICNANYQLVMEGIETQAQFDTAVASGATHLQGYLLGRPEPADDE